MDLVVVPVENPAGLNLIFGQSHFIKTVEDLHETLAGASLDRIARLTHARKRRAASTRQVATSTNT